MMPNPKMEALLNAPPKNVSSKPKIPPASPPNFEGSTPGNTTNDPRRKIMRKPRVFKILVLNSSMENIFFMVVKNFFMALKFFC